jgi:hypothetical protein
MAILRDRQSTGRVRAIGHCVNGPSRQWRCPYLCTCKLHVQMMRVRKGGQKDDSPALPHEGKTPDGTGREARALEAPKDHATSDPTSFLLSLLHTYQHVPSLPNSDLTHQALILAKVGSRMRPPPTDHPTESTSPPCHLAAFSTNIMLPSIIPLAR